MSGWASGKATRLVTFGTPDFDLSVAELTRTPLANGVDSVDVWDIGRFRSTSFYQRHRAILDQPRGSGYWLWKPFIIADSLDNAAEGDVVVYADAGVSILRSLEPLFEQCVAGGGPLLFAGHYDGIGGRPYTCAAWTKRDCFVLTGCDSAEYHRARMVDAAFLCCMKSTRTMQLIHEWQTHCCDARVITDQPNECGLQNLPEFIDHRHDQSVLSLLAAKHNVELFRGPSQFGNHCKHEAYREPGEWLRRPYESSGLYHTSRYPTLTFHHRARRVKLDAATAARLGNSPSYLDVLIAFSLTLQASPRLLYLGRDDGAQASQLADALRTPRCTVAITVVDRAAGVNGQPSDLVAETYDIVVSTASTELDAVGDLEFVAARHLLSNGRALLCWSRLDGLEGWATFPTIRRAIERCAPERRLSVDYGFVNGTDNDRSRPRMLGVAILE